MTKAIAFAPGHISGFFEPIYDQDLSSMEIEGGFDAKDSSGFININAIRLKAHNLVLRKTNPYDWREIQVSSKSQFKEVNKHYGNHETLGEKLSS